MVYYVLFTEPRLDPFANMLREASLVTPGFGEGKCSIFYGHQGRSAGS